MQRLNPVASSRDRQVVAYRVSVCQVVHRNGLRFVPTPEPGDFEVAELLASIARRITREPYRPDRPPSNKAELKQALRAEFEQQHAAGGA